VPRVQEQYFEGKPAIREWPRRQVTEPPEGSEFPFDNVSHSLDGHQLALDGRQRAD
jgi:hypothetical protein